MVQENFGYKQVMAPENSDSKKCLVKKITGLETFLVKKKLGKQLIFASTKIGVQKKKFLRLVGWWEGGWAHIGIKGFLDFFKKEFLSQIFTLVKIKDFWIFFIS